MGAISLSTLNTQDQDLNRVQANVQKALQAIQGQSPFIGPGIFLTGVAVGTGATVITHGLNRIPQAWVICDQNTHSEVSRSAWTSTTLTLSASAACTISLWVN